MFKECTNSLGNLGNVKIHPYWCHVWVQIRNLQQRDPTVYMTYEHLKAVEGYLESFMQRDNVFFSERGVNPTMPLTFPYFEHNAFNLDLFKKNIENVYLDNFIVVVESITVDAILQKVTVYAYSFERNSKAGQVLMGIALQKERHHMIDQFLKDNV